MGDSGALLTLICGAVGVALLIALGPRVSRVRLARLLPDRASLPVVVGWLVAGYAITWLVALGVGALVTNAPLADTNDPWLSAFTDERTGWLNRVMSTVTAMGSYSFTIAVAVLGGVGMSVLLRRPDPLILLGIGLLVGRYLQHYLDVVLGGPEPTDAVSLGPPGPYPSGGVARIMVVAGVLAYYVVRRWPRYRAAAWTLVALLVYVVGLSRLYLGRHFVLDVVGGWIFGACMLATLIGAASLRQRGP